MRIKYKAGKEGSGTAGPLGPLGTPEGELYYIKLLTSIPFYIANIALSLSQTISNIIYGLLAYYLI
jgi:hypothetical protein